MKKTSYSKLRHNILLALSQNPATSITSLAQELGVLRSSVSRAVKTLQDGNLITRKGRTLILTEAGQEEVRRLDATSSKTKDIYTRILEQAIQEQKRLGAIVNSPTVRALELFINNNSSIFRAAEAMTDNPMLRAAKAMTDNPILRINSQLSDAIRATAQIQSINLQWLQSWHHDASSSLNLLLAENNAYLSSIMIDLEALARIHSKFDAIQNLIEGTSETVTAYSNYFNNTASRFSQTSNAEDLELTLVTPTTATSLLVGSARSIIEAQTILAEEQSLRTETTRVIVYSEKNVELISTVVEYLKPLGEHFVNKWEGAWQTLYSNSKDRQSQATHSSRELLIQLLEYLAPNEMFTREDCKLHKVDKPSRKMRIQRILGSKNEHAIGLIDSLAEHLDNMYHILTGQTHRRDGQVVSDNTITWLLAGLGCQLVFLLEQRNTNQS